MTNYEVQFKDGFGCWRRWTRTTSATKAAASLERLERHMGAELVRLGMTRTVER